MPLFEAIVVLHVAAGATGLIAFWGPILTRKGGAHHRQWGRVAARALIIAGVLAMTMALLSLYGPEQRLPMIRDRAVFNGLFGWMMLYLGMLTLSFADYGVAVVRHRRRRDALRTPRHQIVFALTIVLAVNCGLYGLRHALFLMAMVATIGLVAIATQLAFVWRGHVSPTAYVGEHFRALLGMGISAYTAFLSVGLIRLVPEHVFNPLIWALPSLVGVGLIIKYSVTTAPARQAAVTRV